MKKLALTAFGLMVLASTAAARPHGGVFVNFGGGYGCGPRYYTPPVCYSPRSVYYAPRAAYCAPAPIYVPAPVVYAPAYRAPIVTTGVRVSPIVFGWR